MILQSVYRRALSSRGIFRYGSTRAAIQTTYDKQDVIGRTPRRAVLYIPGNDERKIQKLSNLNVDCAVLDCEDGVAMNRKNDARNTITRVLPDLIQNTERGEICARVNSISSGLCEEDINVIFNGKALPQAVMLPKVEKWEEIAEFFEYMTPILKHKPPNCNIKLVIFIETALGLINIKKIIESTIAHSSISKLQFDGVVFGSDDFCASIGVERSENSSELLYARQKIIAHSKAYNLQAIDLVHIDYKDAEGLEKQSLEGANMGFTGKQVIHPNQIDVVQKCFSPSEEKILWANELVEAFNEHQKQGKGAFTFYGKMIDMPLLKQAQSIINISKSLN